MSLLRKLRFPEKLFRMASECESGSIEWNRNGTSIIINFPSFKIEYLSSDKYFKTYHISSFIRSLNMYGFEKQNRSIRRKAEDPEMNEYHHTYFLKDHPHLLRLIRRRTKKIMECNLKLTWNRNETKENNKMPNRVELCRNRQRPGYLNTENFRSFPTKNLWNTMPDNKLMLEDFAVHPKEGDLVDFRLREHGYTALTNYNETSGFEDRKMNVNNVLGECSNYEKRNDHLHLDEANEDHSCSRDLRQILDEWLKDMDRKNGSKDLTKNEENIDLGVAECSSEDVDDIKEAKKKKSILEYIYEAGEESLENSNIFLEVDESWREWIENYVPRLEDCDPLVKNSTSDSCVIDSGSGFSVKNNPVPHSSVEDSGSDFSVKNTGLHSSVEDSSSSGKVIVKEEEEEGKAINLAAIECRANSEKTDCSADYSEILVPALAVPTSSKTESEEINMSSILVAKTFSLAYNQEQNIVILKASDCETVQNVLSIIGNMKIILPAVKQTNVDTSRQA